MHATPRHVLSPVRHGATVTVGSPCTSRERLWRYRRAVERRSCERLVGLPYRKEQRTSSLPPTSATVSRSRSVVERPCGSTASSRRWAEKRRTGPTTHPRIGGPAWARGVRNVHTAPCGRHPRMWSSLEPTSHTVADGSCPRDARCAKSGTDWWEFVCWREAVTARFGQGDGASTARKCGKWLAISQATRGGSLRSARDLEAACLDLGMRKALAAVVAPGLWAGLADGEVLPVESLLAGLHHRSLSSSTRTLHSLQEEQEHEEQLDLDSSTDSTWAPCQTSNVSVASAGDVGEADKAGGGVAARGCLPSLPGQLVESRTLWSEVCLTKGRCRSASPRLCADAPGLHVRFLQERYPQNLSPCGQACKEDVVTDDVDSHSSGGRREATALQLLIGRFPITQCLVDDSEPVASEPSMKDDAFRSIGWEDCSPASAASVPLRPVAGLPSTCHDLRIADLGTSQGEGSTSEPRSASSSPAGRLRPMSRCSVQTPTFAFQELFGQLASPSASSTAGRRASTPMTATTMVVSGPSTPTAMPDVRVAYVESCQGRRLSPCGNDGALPFVCSFTDATAESLDGSLVHETCAIPAGSVTDGAQGVTAVQTPVAAEVVALPEQADAVHLPCSSASMPSPSAPTFSGGDTSDRGETEGEVRETSGSLALDGHAPPVLVCRTRSFLCLDACSCCSAAQASKGRGEEAQSQEAPVVEDTALTLLSSPVILGAMPPDSEDARSTSDAEHTNSTPKTELSFCIDGTEKRSDAEAELVDRRRKSLLDRASLPAKWVGKVFGLRGSVWN